MTGVKEIPFLVLTAFRRRGDLSGEKCSRTGEGGAAARAGAAMGLKWMLDRVFLLGVPRFEGGKISAGITEPSGLMT